MSLLRGLTPVLLLACWPALGPTQEVEDAWTGEGPERNLQFRTLGVADGLSQATINAIAQDHQGYIWLGTQEGLNRFDGVGVTRYSHDPLRPDSLGHDWVADILVDRDGSVWVGTFGGGLSRYDRGGDRFEHLRHDPNDPNSLPAGPVRALLQDHAGMIWIGTDGGGLARLDPATLELVHYGCDGDDPHGLTSDRILDLFEDRRHTLWISTDGGGLLRFSRAANRFHAYRHDPADPGSLPSDRVRSVFEDRDGGLWVGTIDAGLSRLTPAQGGFEGFPTTDGADDGPRGPIRDIAQDADGTLWVASASGLCEWLPRSESFTCYRQDPTDPMTLPDDRVMRVFQDRGGVLWIGTYKGAASWNYISDAFRYFQKGHGAGDGLSEDIVTAVAEDPRGRLWVGTYGGGLNRLDLASDKVEVIRHDPSRADTLSGDRVTAVHVDGEGMVWIGTRGNGLNRLDPSTGQVRRFVHAEDDPRSLGGNGVTDIISDDDGRLWVASFGGGLSRLDDLDGGFTVFRHDPHDPHSISSDRVLALLQDSDGRLWIGTEDAGLNQLSADDGGFIRHRHDPARPDSLSSDTAWHLMEDNEGGLWIATMGGGVNHWRLQDRRAGDAIFRRYTKRDGLLSNSIQAALQDRLGAIWLSSNNGLSRLDPATGALRHFDTENGLKSNEFMQGAAIRTRRGELVFGGANGLVLFQPRRIRTNRHPPQVAAQIRSPRGVLGHAYSSAPEPARVVLGYQDYTVSFELAALDFASPGKNRFRYRLEGFERDWVNSGPFRRATYTNLPPRRYRFRVEAINNDGATSERSADVVLVVEPPPWRSIWAYGLYASVLIALVWTALYNQRKRLRWEAAQRQLLEEKVRQRTQEISERSQALEDLNQRLKQASVTDALTGLKNRRYFYEAIETEISMIRRLYNDSVPVAEFNPRVTMVPFLFFMMIDLDGFKAINDRYGHHAGDAALRQVRDLLRACCRDADTIVRWGGDEFLIYGRTGGRVAAEKLAERIRRTLAEEPYALGDGNIGRLSGSIGLVTYPMEPGKPDLVDWETTLTIADHASYVAKKNSRNAWVAIYASGQGFTTDTAARIKGDLAELLDEGVLQIETSIEARLRTLSEQTEAR